MGWFDRIFTAGGGEDPLAVQQRAEGQRRLDAAAAQAAQDRAMQMQIDYLNQLRADQAAKEAAEAAKDPTATRQAALSSIGQYFAPEFESSFVPDTSTDALEAEAYNAQRGTADEYLNRLLKRGVITDTGRAAAAANLDTQGARVRQQLKDLGDTIVNAEREKIGGYAGRAKERASALNVGEGFDITPYSTGAQNELASFTSGLPDLYKSQVPTDLFDTASLGAIAGGAQGAGNTPFDPDIQPGQFASTSADETDPFADKTKKRTSTVF